jgi:hypothetical protein
MAQRGNLGGITGTRGLPKELRITPGSPCASKSAIGIWHLWHELTEVNFVPLR